MTAAPELDLDDIACSEALQVAVLLHGVPMNLDEIVRVMRGAGHDVDGDDVEVLLRSAGIQPRLKAIYPSQVRKAAARRIGAA